MRRISVLSVALLLWFGGPEGRAHAGSADTQTLAKELLNATGRRKGLCVLLGCGDGRLAAALAKEGEFLVHGLALEKSSLEDARRHIQSQELYGQASVELGDVRKLPYADNLVDVLVADGLQKLLARGLSLKEIMRVVCPKGVAMLGQRQGGSLTEGGLKTKLREAGVQDYEIVKQDGLWAKVIKPRPQEMDEWTHWRYNPEGSCVSKEKSFDGAPTGLRWIAGPVTPKGGRKRSTPVALSSGGRILYRTVNESSNLTRPKDQARWHLLARDAYNGLFLWKQPWENARYTAYRPRPYHQAGSPLVVVDERIYTAIKVNSVTILDSATGEILKTCELGEEPIEMALKNGNLIAATAKNVFSIDPEEGKVRWKAPAAAMDLMLSDEGIFFLEIKKHPYDLVALEFAGGREHWRVSTAPLKLKKEKRGHPINLRLIESGVLALGSRKDLHAYSTADGKNLWNTNTLGPPRRFDNIDIFAFDGLIWTPRVEEYTEGRKRRAKGYLWEGYDPKTGRVERSVKYRRAGGGCGMTVGANGTVIFPKSLRFLNLRTGRSTGYGGARGPCASAALPANGLVYTYPYNCSCARNAFLGATGRAVTRNPRTKEALTAAGERLEKGPSYNRPLEAGSHRPSDWPTFRYDVTRSGATPAAVPAELKVLWSKQVGVTRPAGPLGEDWRIGLELGDTISAPTIAGGMVFVAIPDAHCLAALDAKSGKACWRFTAGGRIDSPPTYENGFCLVGCKDGYVYCLNAADGRLAWRFRAAPDRTRIVAFGQIESPWPVSGSILVQNGVAAFAAGRSSASDYGFSVTALDARTGKLVWEKTTLPAEKGARTFGGVCQSILVGDGKDFYMSYYRFSSETGDFVSTYSKDKGPPVINAHRHGLLSGQWRELPGYTSKRGHALIHDGIVAHLMAFARDKVFAYRLGWSSRRGWMVVTSEKLFAKEKGKSEKDGTLWSQEVPMPLQMEAMILAGDNLFLAGTRNFATHEGKGILWVFSAGDGKKLKEYELSTPPVFEGLAAAGGRLYVATQDGKLLCFGKE